MAAALVSRVSLTMRLASPVQGWPWNKWMMLLIRAYWLQMLHLGMVNMEKKWSLSGLYSLMVCCDSYQVVGEIHLSTQVNSLSRELRLYGEVKGKEVKAWALIL